MDQVFGRLCELEFFSALDPSAVAEIAACGEWYSLGGGWPLFEAGDPPDALFFNLSGRLIVTRKTDEGDDVVGYVRAGEPVGEMALMADEPHSASVLALRDTEVLRLGRKAFDDILRRHGSFASALARVILNRARQPKASFQRSAPRVFALIGSSPSIDIDRQARDLATRIAAAGLRVDWRPVAEDAPGSRAFDQNEESHDVLLLAARVDDSPWYRFVLRHADRFLVFARRDARPPRPFPLTTEAGVRARAFRLVDLIMLYEGVPACPVIEWADAVGAARIFACRGDPCRDRIARIIAGRSVGLVLSGGGARAYAHIGAVRAIREAGLPIDFVSGASMGAVIAACVAMGWNDQEIEKRIRAAFVDSNPLGDHVLPVIALTKGRRVDERLAENFDDALIEELTYPFFCVSSDITDGTARVHRRGSLRHALRASIALPGILPPVIDGNSLLVDGAVVNNFPTDVMAATHRGVTIGIDVARQGTIDVEAFRDPPGFFGWISQHGVGAAPPIVSLLMRTATARHEAMLKVHPADIMITPDVPGVELRDWTSYDEAVSDGYKTARAALQRHESILAAIVTR